MLQKAILSSLVLSISLSTSIYAFSLDLNDEIKKNEELIKEYKINIEKLQKRNNFLLDKKAKNPNLYVKKDLYEETNDSYIHRVKLDGAKANKVSVTIKNHHLSIEMNIKNEEQTDNSYYSSSRYFSQLFSIPSNVDESKIKHEVDGDYFVIIMPKK
ncbi:Hsp20/alpha crystallin family protein [Sulfurimonas sp.]